PSRPPLLARGSKVLIVESKEAGRIHGKARLKIRQKPFYRVMFARPLTCVLRSHEYGANIDIHFGRLAWRTITPANRNQQMVSEKGVVVIGRELTNVPRRVSSIIRNDWISHADLNP